MADRWINRSSPPILLAAVSAFAASLTLAAPPGTQISNVASVQFTTTAVPAPPPQTVQSNAATTVVSAAASLTVTKSARPSGTVAPGTSIQFRLLVDNATGIDVTGAQVTDPLDLFLGTPTGISTGSVPNRAPGGGSISLTGTWSAGTREVIWTIPLVPAGARFEVVFTATIDPATPDDTLVPNTASQISVQDPAGTTSNTVQLAVVSPALTISKEASRPRAEVGDPIGYTVHVSNISAALFLSNVEVTDNLPKGFRFQEGSARLDGRPIPDPIGSKRRLTFALGGLSPGTAARLSYVAIPGPDAERTDAINEAVVTARTPGGVLVTAGPARAAVRISGSLLSAEPVILGRVFVDANHNGIVDEGEPGVPGARLFLEDGSWAVTDVLGKYHIEGSRPGLHVLKVDETTVPPDLAPFAHAVRSGVHGSTQFVDVGSGEVWKGNVAVAGWGTAVSRLQARGVFRKRERGEPARFAEREEIFPPLLASAFFKPDSIEIEPAGMALIHDYGALVRERGSGLVELEVIPSWYAVHDEGLMRARASRLEGELRRLVMASAGAPGRPPAGPDGEPGERPTEVAQGTGAASGGGAAPAAGAGRPELEALAERVKQMDPTAAILTPDESHEVRVDRGAVEVKLPAGLTPRLRVNDEEISRDQIAVRMETSLSQVAFFRYLGVPFKPGRNAVVLEGVDTFGNRRAWVERTVLRVGPPASIELNTGDAPVRPDGRTPTQVRATVRDAEGLTVEDGTLVTLQLSDGEFLGVDADPREEGFQAPTRDGVVVAHMAPVSSEVQPTVTVAAAGAQGELTLSSAADMRQWIIAGIGEAAVGYAGASGDASVSEMLEGDGSSRGRMAVFARGQVFPNALLSLSYDSGRRKDPDALFREVAPDRFFPIYGDSSLQGYDVETQGKLALRLDHPNGMLALGDFTAALPGGDLTRYDRALSGGVGRIDLGHFNARTFAASTQQTQARDDIPGAGTSGPYRLSRRPVVINSERITLETRDRYRPERVLASTELSRYADYDIDTTNGILLFKRPVPFNDDDMQPVVIVALYEVIGGTDEQTVAGGRVGYRIGEFAEVGGTYVHEGRVGGSLSLAGADFRLRRSFTALSGGSVEMTAEAAATETTGGDPSSAVSWRAAAQMGGRVTLSGYYRKVGEAFDNTSRGGLSDVGTIRWGLAGGVRVGEASRVAADVFQQEDTINDQQRRVAALDWERDMARVTARAGLKDVRADSSLTGQTESSRLALAGVGLRLSQRLDGVLAHQQVVSGAAMPEYPTRSTAGFSFKVTEQVRAFMRYELDNADVGRASRSVVGMESQLGRATVLESRYSLEDALLGERGYAQIGLRTRLPLSADWMGDASLERVQTTQGVSGGDFTALATGFEYLPARVKLALRYEVRFGDLEDRHTVTAAGATRITDNLSFFTRQRLFFVAPEAAGDHLDGDGLLGLAYRPVDSDRLNYLFKVQALKGEGALGAGSPAARSLLAVLEVSHQPAARVHLLGRVGWRRSSDLLDGSQYATIAWLGEGRFLVDVTDRVNAGASFRVMEQPGVDTALTGWGLESGIRVGTDLWLVAGYNVSGFSASGFADAERREAGPFLTMRFKFDEQTLLGFAQAMRPPRFEPIP